MEQAIPFVSYIQPARKGAYMKLKFKTQNFQTDAVKAILCFLMDAKCDDAEWSKVKDKLLGCYLTPYFALSGSPGRAFFCLRWVLVL